VLQHNSKNNCWVVYANKVYNVTSYVSQHPGGQSVFNSTTCGHDITNYLNGSASSGGLRHVHSSASYSILSTYFIANLSG
jgi:4-hydroxysphinganine ceramide fatty acyl 2-hydroxylase